MDSKPSYKSKLRSSSKAENNNVGMKSDEKIQPRKRIKIDADFTTPISTREFRSSSSKKVATPQAPRANRSILEVSMASDSPSSSQNIGSFDKTPKRRSLRKFRLSEGQPKTNIDDNDDLQVKKEKTPKRKRTTPKKSAPKKRKSGGNESNEDVEEG
uniref:Uncharacterized protein n=1 Tax=Panagrolaimus sp. PS1159 TaxID=55785 RepID=A0AC35F9D3_9BILA